jgi:hypothetical protein
MEVRILGFTITYEVQTEENIFYLSQTFVVLFSLYVLYVKPDLVVGTFPTQ